MIDFDEQPIATQVKNWLSNKIVTYEQAVNEPKGTVALLTEEDGVGVSPGVFRVLVTGRLKQNTSRNALFNTLKSKAQEAGIIPRILFVRIWKHECSPEQMMIYGGCIDQLVYSYDK